MNPHVLMLIMSYMYMNAGLSYTCIAKSIHNSGTPFFHF